MAWFSPELIQTRHSLLAIFIRLFWYLTLNFTLKQWNGGVFPALIEQIYGYSLYLQRVGIRLANLTFIFIPSPRNTFGRKANNHLCFAHYPRTKHIEVYCHFVRDKLINEEVVTPYMKSEDQLADLFTKALGRDRVEFLCNKLGLYDIYSPA